MKWDPNKVGHKLHVTLKYKGAGAKCQDNMPLWPESSANCKSDQSWGSQWSKAQVSTVTMI